MIPIRRADTSPFRILNSRRPQKTNRRIRCGNACFRKDKRRQTRQNTGKLKTNEDKRRQNTRKTKEKQRRTKTTAHDTQGTGRQTKTNEDRGLLDRKLRCRRALQGRVQQAHDCLERARGRSAQILSSRRSPVCGNPGQLSKRAAEKYSETLTLKIST